MLGILLIYFIGKHFYKMAETYNKSKWLFAVLGVIMYYVGTFIGGVVLALLDEIFVLGINWENNFTLGIMALPFGIALDFVFYKLLEKKWKKEFIPVGQEIDQIGQAPDTSEN
jgi:hypothetical protein